MKLTRTILTFLTVRERLHHLCQARVPHARRVREYMPLVEHLSLWWDAAVSERRQSN